MRRRCGSGAGMCDGYALGYHDVTQNEVVRCMPSSNPAHDNPRAHELHAWFWLWLPLLLWGLHYPAWLLLSEAAYDNWFVNELGLTEMATTVFALTALVVSLMCARHFWRAGRTHLALWFALMTLGCFYFAGEEASWGQHLLGWHTPDGWALHNDQAETNLHNSDGPLGGLLDQLPRNLLTLVALIAGGIMPLVRRARQRPLAPDSTAYWLLPALVCVPAGLASSLSTVPGKLEAAFLGTTLIDIQDGEIKELLLAFFLMIYALSVWQRARLGRVAA